MPPPEPVARTPAKKRDRRQDVNATMETADMSMEEDIGGPVSPPSSKKLAVASWDSSPPETVSNATVRDEWFVHI